MPVFYSPQSPQGNSNNDLKIVVLFFIAGLIVAAGIFFVGCGNARTSRSYTTADFYPPFTGAGGISIHLDRSLTNQERQWATESVVEHFWTWNSAHGPLQPRAIDLYVFDLTILHGPFGYAQTTSYLQEDGPRDEIHVAFGYKGTLPTLMQELHLASMLPGQRDYFHQDPHAGWDSILGYTIWPGGVAPPNGTVVPQGYGTYIPGLQEQVVWTLEARR